MSAAEENSKNREAYETDRKRGRDEEENKEGTEIFRTSKITVRSPTSKGNFEAREMEEFKELIKECISELKEEMKANKEETLREIKNNSDEVQKLRSELERKEQLWEQERKKLNDKIAEIENKLEKQEREKRRNNIIISGVSAEAADTETLKVETEKFFKGRMNIDVKIKSAFTIGPKLCVVEMDNWEQKSQVMKNKNKLKGSSIYINNDLTKTERVIQNEIKAVAKQEKDKGGRVKIGYQKLILNGKEFAWNKEEGKLVAKAVGPDRKSKN